jgi:DNA polymerase-3 subunit delta
MTPAQLQKEIGSDRYRPVYYFYGEEDYRKAEAVKYILSNYLPKQQRLLNFTRLTVDKQKFETICGEVAAIPMLGERRFVFVDEIQKLKPTQQKKFFAFLKDLPENILIILSSPAAHTPAKKSAFLREVSKIAEPVKFDRLTARNAKSRIESHLRAAGFTYDNEAVDLLNSLTGGDFGGLAGELEKLSLSSEEGSHIGLDEVKKLVSAHEDFTIFELIDLIAAKNADRALYVCNDLMQRGIKPVPILIQLSRHMMNLTRIHAGKKMAGHPYFVEKLRKQARDFEESRVIEAISRIAGVERDIRRSAVKDSILLENMIREICR